MIYAFSSNELIIFVAQITTNYIPRNSVNIYDGFNRRRSEVIYEGDLLITGETITRLGNAAYLSYDGQLLLFLCALNNSATNDICLADLVDAGSGQTPRFSAINPRAIIRSSTQKSLGGWASNTRRFVYWEQGIANFVYDVDTGQTQQLNLNKASLRWEQDGKLYFTKQIGFTYARYAVNADNTGLFQYILSSNSETRILNPNNYPLYTACQGQSNLYPYSGTLDLAHKSFAVSPQRDIIAYLGQPLNRECYNHGLNSRTRLETIVKYKGQNAQHGDSAFGATPSYSMEWSPIHTGYLAVVSGNTLRILFVGNGVEYLVAYTLQDADAVSHDLSLQSGQGNLAIPMTNPLHWVVLPPPQAPTPTPTPSPTSTLPYCDEVPSCPPGVICPDPSPTGIAMRPGEMAAPQSINGNTCQVRPTATPSATPTATATPDPLVACSSTDAIQLRLTLSSFGITSVPQIPAIPIPTPTPVGGRIDWTVIELQQICLSVTHISMSFLEQTERVDTPQVIFKEVMGVEDNGVLDQGPIELIRVNNRPNCIASNAYRTITCGDLVDYQNNPRSISQYVITHEFGHIFDNQADRGNGRALREYIADTRLNPNPTAIGTHVQGPIWDFAATQGVVMGTIELCNQEWLRGERGWGSGPGSSYNPLTDFCTPREQVFTDFQQNTAPYNTPEDANMETAADMFLNWVYRKLAIGGFLNRDWRPHITDPITNISCNQTLEGCDNSQAASGDARFNWIQTVINEIFAARDWTN